MHRSLGNEEFLLIVKQDKLISCYVKILPSTQQHSNKFSWDLSLSFFVYTNLGLDMNGTHQVLAYAEDVNLIGDDIRTIERNADVLLNACKDIGSAVNIGKTK